MGVEEIEDPVHAEVVSRINRQSQGPKEDSQRIEQAEELDTAGSCCEQGEQQVILGPSPARRVRTAASPD